MIEGRGVDRSGPPLGYCWWCWQPAWDAGKIPGVPAFVPLHITCAMQILVVQRRLREDHHLRRTVAALRYWRLRRTLRKLETARRRRPWRAPSLPRVEAGEPPRLGPGSSGCGGE